MVGRHNKQSISATCGGGVISAIGTSIDPHRLQYWLLATTVSLLPFSSPPMPTYIRYLYNATPLKPIERKFTNHASRIDHQQEWRPYVLGLE